jgi:DNA-binding response OmpR family regulator
MPKILLFRAARDLSARLVAELSRAGYDVAALETADVRTVLQQQPDLILLQTDVRTLDCCGLLTQLKGNEATAPVKIILLAEGGPLERSRALDLGADDVLSIPFEPVELFARVRAQLREKAPDDRLRLEVLDAKRKELEAEAALAAIVAEKGSGRRRWIALGVVTALAAIGAGIAVRNAQVTRKSNASLVLQLENLRSEILTQSQLLARAQKSREASNQELTASVSKQLEDLRAESADLRKQISSSAGASLSELDSRLKETDSRIGKLESESRIAQEIVRNYSNSVCLIYAIVGFRDKQSGAILPALTPTAIRRPMRRATSLSPPQAPATRCRYIYLAAAFWSMLPATSSPITTSSSRGGTTPGQFLHQATPSSRPCCRFGRFFREAKPRWRCAYSV